MGNNDYLKKEPTKNEKMIYELFMQQQSMDRALFTNSTLLLALALHNGIKPEELAEYLVNGNDKIKEYSTQVNKSIEEKEKAKHKDHDHSHAGHGHNEASSEPEKAEESK